MHMYGSPEFCCFEVSTRKPSGVTVCAVPEVCNRGLRSSGRWGILPSARLWHGHPCWARVSQDHLYQRLWREYFCSLSSAPLILQWWCYYYCRQDRRLLWALQWWLLVCVLRMKWVKWMLPACIIYKTTCQILLKFSVGFAVRAVTGNSRLSGGRLTVALSPPHPPLTTMSCREVAPTLVNTALFVCSMTAAC
jgi:hypothetical protein